MDGAFVSFNPKLFFAALFCLIILCNCGGENNNRISESPNELPVASEVEFNDTQTGMQIRQDYLNYLVGIDDMWNLASIDDIWIDENYGVYNGYVVVLIANSRNYAAVMTHAIIDGILFNYSNPAQTIIAWENGRIYTLQEVCDLDILEREDLMAIADLRNGNHDSSDGSHVGLSIGVENMVKKTYLDYLFYNGLQDLSDDDTWIDAYYGTYNGGIAVMMDFTDSGYACAEREIVIAGTLFHYNSENNILWAQEGNVLYDLQEAYDLGLLTLENLSDMANRLAFQPINCNN